MNSSTAFSQGQSCICMRCRLATAHTQCCLCSCVIRGKQTTHGCLRHQTPAPLCNPVVQYRCHTIYQLERLREEASHHTLDPHCCSYKLSAAVDHKDVKPALKSWEQIINCMLMHTHTKYKQITRQQRPVRSTVATQTSCWGWLWCIQRWSDWHRFSHWPRAAYGATLGLPHWISHMDSGPASMMKRLILY